ncbi:asparaginase [Diplodia corticola]|uniref:Asparaginase n=1 Tax=Diplodia corticola TaxID=236234 RepID=A0A1J9RND1_9PEZI|nr:asparaginase [Diplodia corticola]OJD29999.1 asparaginase [Diplodia corticola]
MTKTAATTPSSPTPSDFVLTDRGGIIENRHAVHAAIVSSSPTTTTPTPAAPPNRPSLLYSLGNPHRPTLIRSAAKPAQALAILSTGCFRTCAYTPADLALICASHSSEPRHLSRAAAMLARAGPELLESDLRCGGHPALLNAAVDRAWIKSDFVPGPLCNNCSGKHVGMLAGALALGADPAAYHLLESPMQERVREAVEATCGLRAEDVRWAVDGCNLPAPAVPLDALAGMYAAFAAARDAAGDGDGGAGGGADSGGGLGARGDAERRADMARVFDAMAAYPEMVGGEGRFCTVLMEAFGGMLIGKVGADGCYGVGVRASEQTRRLGAEGALGIAVKIEDGSVEIVYAVVAEILEQLQIGTPEMREKLAAFHHLKRLNTAQVVTGKVSMPFKVRGFGAADPVLRTEER